ncbi:MAG TPA: PBP1A family penicillin-binding protein [Caulobacteraceae bacterium]|nr:PBP1A family penicillin-binding protein [Caulobacteraceae bacterium]
MTVLPRRVLFAGRLLAVVAGLAGVSAAVYAAVLFHQMPSAAELADYHPPTATRVYAWDGTLLGEFSKVRRIYVPYDQIPPRLRNAFLAAEDHNFFEHGGVDPGGLSRALFKDVFNLLQGKRPEGGSTITQQVAKNIALSNEVSVGRKLKEALLANRLEEVLSKQQILELYLNEIWLGYRSYGVGAAAYNYFGKSISDLTLAQCAYLAALPKGPDNYQPVRQKAAAVRRRNMILAEMASLGFATRAEAEQAMKEDLVVQSAPARTRYHDADYFVDQARRDALGLKDVGANLDKGGYYMRTTLDSRLQTAARIALMDGLETYDRRHGWRGAWGHVAAQPGWQQAALAASPPSERRKWAAAMVTQAKGAVRIQLAATNQTGEIVPADAAWARAGKGLSVGDLVFVEPIAQGPGSGAFNLRQIPAVNGAIVAMDPSNGRTLALVGGYSYSLSKFDRATQAYRQPGSSFKPFVYAAALQSGQFTPASMVSAGPITLPGANGQPWSPENYERDEHYGNLVFRRGLELSLNTMTVRIAQQVRMGRIVALAKSFGVIDHMEPVLSMALGAGETTPFRMTGAYASFVNGGHQVQPHLIELMEKRTGQMVWSADHRACPGCEAAFTGADGPDVVSDGQPLVDPITAYQIDTMLEGVVQHGTAVAAQSLGRPIGGKTGTTNDFRSAWFMGFTPQIVVGVFVGFDDNRSLGKGETGAVAALPVFIEFMHEALKGMPVMDFKPPPDARLAWVGPNREAFRPGTEPRVAAASAEASPDQPVGPDAVISPTPPPLPVPGVKPPAAAPPPKKPDDLRGLY